MTSDDDRLEKLFPPGGEPDPAGLERTVRAVRARIGRRRGRTLVLRAAAAAILLGAGFLAGTLLRPGGGGTAAPLPADLAEHERTVFAAIRESRGEELRWMATSGGEVRVGLSGAALRGPVRVLFVETFDGEGGLIARTRVVLPEGEPVRVAFPGGPALDLAASRRDGTDRVRCEAEFPDGARVGSPDARVEPGARTLIGKVTTDGRTVSLYVACF